MAIPEAKKLPPGIRPRCRENMLVPSERFVTVSKEKGMSPQDGEQMLKDNTARFSQSGAQQAFLFLQVSLGMPDRGLNPVGGQTA